MTQTIVKKTGLNVYGDSLDITFVEESSVSCQCSITRSSKTPVWALSLAAAVAVLTLYKVVYSSIVFITYPVALAAYFIHYRYFAACEEFVWIVKGFGLVVGQKFRSGRQRTEFFQESDVGDIVINEGITMHKVIFYLALLIVSDEANGSCGFKLVPLFMNFTPSLEAIKPIYYGMKNMMFINNKK